MGKYWVGTGKNRHRTKAGYEHEYKEFKSGAREQAKNTARKSARRAAERKGLVHKGDGKDVDHIRGTKAGNGSSNIRIMSASANRARRQGPRKRGSKRSRSWKW